MADSIENDALKDASEEIEGQELETNGGEKTHKVGIDPHKVESALGRISGVQSKVDSLESKFSDLDTKLDTILSTVTAGSARNEPEYTEDMDFMPSTQGELDHWYDKRRLEEIQRDTEYSGQYVKQLGELGKGEDGISHKAILAEMKENFNIRHSDNGLMDAETNYNRASRGYYKKQLDLKGKTNPLKGPGKDQPPLGAGLDGEEMVEKDVPMPKLDKYAQDFVDKTGMSKEKVVAALRGEMPTGLRPNEKIG